jgi:hypothetical protein
MTLEIDFTFSRTLDAHPVSINVLFRTPIDTVKKK